MYMDTTDLLTNVLSVSTSIKLLNSSAIALMVLTKLKEKAEWLLQLALVPSNPNNSAFLEDHLEIKEKRKINPA